ncbi:MAG: hypothetical protein V8T29_00865 [Oscillospiraceae bacterium]
MSGWEGIFVLLIIHHVLNISWWKNMGKGRYSRFRKVQTMLDMLILADMLWNDDKQYFMLSIGFFQSAYQRNDAGQDNSSGWFLLGVSSCYHSTWDCIFLCLQAWRKKRLGAEKYVTMGKAFRWLFYLTALYGVFAFIQRDLWHYMLLLTHFAFFDYEESAIFFLLDYLAISITFAFIGSRIAKWAVHPVTEKKMGK